MGNTNLSKKELEIVLHLSYDEYEKGERKDLSDNAFYDAHELQTSIHDPLLW